jgi:hypothetical protein
MLQLGAGSSSEPLRDPVATSEPAVELSAKCRDESVVQILPEIKPRTPPFGVSSTGIPQQAATTSSTPAAEGLGHLVSGVGWTPSGEESPV